MTLAPLAVVSRMHWRGQENCRHAVVNGLGVPWRPSDTFRYAMGAG